MPELSGSTRVENSLLAEDKQLLLHAPLVLRELRRRNTVTVDQFVNLLQENLQHGLSVDGWLRELIEGGQFALAHRLLKYNGGFTNNELRQLARQGEKKCDELIAHAEHRLELQKKVLSPEVVVDLETALGEARVLRREYWLDLSREQVAEVERLLDIEVAKALREREARFELAREAIEAIRHEAWYQNTALRERGMFDLVQELLYNADRMSMNMESDLDQVQRLCGIVREIIQGAYPDDAVLAEYRQAASRPAVPAPTRASAPQATLAPEQAVTVNPTRPTPGWLSSAVASFVSEVLHCDSTLIHHDLTERPLPSKMEWNEETADEKQRRIFALARNIGTNRGSEADRANEMLPLVLYLLRYWVERRKQVVPGSAVREQLISNLGDYARLRASSYLKAGCRDSAAEYLRICLTLRSERKSLAGAEEVFLNYLACYSAVGARDESVVRAVNEWSRTLKSTETLTEDEVLARTVAQILNVAQQPDYPTNSAAFVMGLMKLAADSTWLSPALQSAFDTATGNLRDALGAGLKQLSPLLQIPTSEPFSAWFTNLVSHYVERQAVIRGVLEQPDTSGIHALGQAIQLIESLQRLGDPFEPTDQDILDQLGTIRESLQRYVSPGLPFVERDRLADALLQKDTQAVLKSVDASPTRFGVLYIRRLIDAMQYLIEMDLAALRQVSLPVISVTIEKSEWRSDEHYYCHLYLENNGETSAEDVKILIEESPIGEYVVPDGESEFVLGTISPGQNRNLLVRLVPTPLDKDQDAFAIHVRLSYSTSNKAERENRSLRIRVDGFTLRRGEASIIPNNYVVGGIVRSEELFRGRERDIASILGAVCDPGHTAAAVMFGQKRSGKSSLLYHLGRHVPDFTIPVLFDIPTILIDLPSVRSGEPLEGQTNLLLGRFLFALIKRTLFSCEALKVTAHGMSWDELMAEPGPGFHFRHFLEQFRDRPDRRRMLFMFDEFTALIDKIDEDAIDSAIMKLLKSLIEQGYISCVICGLTEVYDAVKRFANQLAVAQLLQLDYLDRDAASGLIQDPIRMPDGRSRFNSLKVVDEIIDLTAGNPFYIQTFCSRLVTYMNRAGIETVTGADVEAVTKSLIEGSQRMESVQFDNLYRYAAIIEGKDYQDSEAIRQALLEGLIVHLMAHETATKTYAPLNAIYRHISDFVTESELDATIGRLEQRQTIVRQVDDTNQARHTMQPLRTRNYRIRVDLFRRWSLANQPVDEEALRSFASRLRRLD